MRTTFGGGDLPGTLSLVALVLAILGVIVLIVAGWGRRRGDTMIAVKSTAALARVWIVVGSLGMIVLAIGAFTSDFIELQQPIIMSTSGIQGDGVACTVPAADAGTAPYLCDNTVYGSSLGTHLLLGAGDLLVAAASIAIGWCIYVAARRATLGTPFDRSVGTTFANAGYVVLGAGMLGGLLQQIAMNLAVSELPGGADEGVAFYLTLEYWPLLVSLGCFAMAAIFRHGARLQNEAARLQKETEGLV